MRPLFTAISLTLLLFPLASALADSQPQRPADFCEQFQLINIPEESAYAGCGREIQGAGRFVAGWKDDAMSRGEKAKGCRHFRTRLTEISEARSQALTFCNNSQYVGATVEGAMLQRNEEAASLRTSAITHMEKCIARLTVIKNFAHAQTIRKIDIPKSYEFRDLLTAKDVQGRLRSELKRNFSALPPPIGQEARCMRVVENLRAAATRMDSTYANIIGRFSDANQILTDDINGFQVTKERLEMFNRRP